MKLTEVKAEVIAEVEAEVKAGNKSKVKAEVKVEFWCKIEWFRGATELWNNELQTLSAGWNIVK